MLSFLLLLGFLATCSGWGERPRSLPQAVLAGAVAGLPVLFYKPAAPIVAAFMVATLLRRRPVASSFAFIAATAATIGVGFTAAVALKSSPLSWWEFAIAAKDNLHFVLRASHLPRGLFSLSSDFVAMGWVFGHPGIVRALSIVYPDKIVVEEVFAASRAGWLTSVPYVTLPVLAAVTVWILASARRSGARGLGNAATWLLAAWVLSLGGLLMLLEPSSVEPWTLTLPALFLLIGRFVLEPASSRVAPAVFAVLLTAFALHNSLAGIGVVYSAEGDYYAVLLGPAAADARPTDLLLTTNRKLATYVANETSLPVSNLSAHDPPSVDEIESRLGSGGRLFVAEDVASPPPAIARRYPSQAPVISRFWQGIRDRAREFSRTPAGTVYVVDGPGGAR